jgi:hypothetical protein
LLFPFALLYEDFEPLELIYPDSLSDDSDESEEDDIPED